MYLYIDNLLQQLLFSTAAINIPFRCAQSAMKFGELMLLLPRPPSTFKHEEQKEIGEIQFVQRLTRHNFSDLSGVFLTLLYSSPLLR